MNVVLILIAVVTLFITGYATYKAFTNGDNWWGVGILVAWFVGLGWLVALVYLFAIDRRRAVSS